VTGLAEEEGNWTDRVTSVTFLQRVEREPGDVMQHSVTARLFFVVP
jgi:hypothetical protein